METTELRTRRPTKRKRVHKPIRRKGPEEPAPDDDEVPDWECPQEDQ